MSCQPAASQKQQIPYLCPKSQNLTYTLYAEVVLPLPLPRVFSYAVPEEFVSKLQFGIRVEVPFGKNKRYSALVVSLSNTPPEGYKVKPIINILDDEPIIYPVQYQFWKWIAGYYFSTVGEVMNAALPAYLKLSGETNILLSPLYSDNFEHLSEKEYLIASALKNREEFSIDEARKILDQKTVMPIIKKMLDEKIIYLHETLKEKYKPKKVLCVRYAEPYASDSSKLAQAFELTKSAPKQTETLLAYAQLSKTKTDIRKQELYKMANSSAAALNGLVKKGILEIYDKNISRIETYDDDLAQAHPLTAQQTRAIGEIDRHFEEKNTVLLHGVTGSGKTRVYIEKIWEAISNGGQVLYILPEIALTSQIIGRLRQIFGDDIVVYHSRLNNNERVEIWQQVLEGKPIVLSARSGVFLPFQHLKLLIVDEEHDQSFKQFDPAPRYHGRDAGLMLANLFKAKSILGTATPSLETYVNAKNNKYGLVSMPDRFGNIMLPKIFLVDLKKEAKEHKLQSHFSSFLLDEIKATLANKQQVILFQNRRGYAPTLTCNACGWYSECKNCDIGLTYHKYSDNLRCHFCGFHQKLPHACPTCGTQPLTLAGFGTQKIEEELKIFFPQAKTGRMDYDTTGGKTGFERIINAFDAREIEILVGTQMVTKGLDFDNVGLVGIMSADQLLFFPDFRAAERAFQQMTQVSGRAGRKNKRGKVVIQAFQSTHPVIKDVMDGQFETFIQRELAERKAFGYPPYMRLIRLTIKHRQYQNVETGAKLVAHILNRGIKGQVIGPAWHAIPRIRNQYQMTILIKLSRQKGILAHTRSILDQAIVSLKSQKGLSGVRVNVDVDPY